MFPHFQWFFFFPSLTILDSTRLRFSAIAIQYLVKKKGFKKWKGKKSKKSKSLKVFYSRDEIKSKYFNFQSQPLKLLHGAIAQYLNPNYYLNGSNAIWKDDRLKYKIEGE